MSILLLKQQHRISLILIHYELLWSSARVLLVYMGLYIAASSALNHSVCQSKQFIKLMSTLFPKLTHGTVLLGNKNPCMLLFTHNAIDPCYVFFRVQVRAANFASEYVKSICVVNEEHQPHV